MKGDSFKEIKVEPNEIKITFGGGVRAFEANAVIKTLKGLNYHYSGESCKDATVVLTFKFLDEKIDYQQKGGAQWLRDNTPGLAV